MDTTNVQQLIADKVPVAEFLGLHVDAVYPGHVRLSLPFAPQVLNHLEIVYAGAIFALAEIAGGVLMLATFDSEKYTVLIRRMAIDYARPSRRDLFCDVRLGDDRVAEMQRALQQQGHAEVEFSIEVTDARMRVIASVQAFYYLREI